jgi:hypothetical protein
MVEDTANNIVGRWDALIALYDNGDGKLTGLSVSALERASLEGLDGR